MVLDRSSLHMKKICELGYLQLLRSRFILFIAIFILFCISHAEAGGTASPLVSDKEGDRGVSFKELGKKLWRFGKGRKKTPYGQGGEVTKDSVEAEKENVASTGQDSMRGLEDITMQRFMLVHRGGSLSVPAVATKYIPLKITLDNDVPFSSTFYCKSTSKVQWWNKKPKKRECDRAGSNVKNLLSKGSLYSEYDYSMTAPVKCENKLRSGVCEIKCSSQAQTTQEEAGTSDGSVTESMVNRKWISAPKFLKDIPDVDKNNNLVCPVPSYEKKKALAHYFLVFTDGNKEWKSVKRTVVTSPDLKNFEDHSQNPFEDACNTALDILFSMTVQFAEVDASDIHFVKALGRGNAKWTKHGMLPSNYHVCLYTVNKNLKTPGAAETLPSSMLKPVEIIEFTKENAWKKCTEIVLGVIRTKFKEREVSTKQQEDRVLILINKSSKTDGTQAGEKGGIHIVVAVQLSPDGRRLTCEQPKALKELKQFYDGPKVYEYCKRILENEKGLIDFFRWAKGK